MSTIKKTILFFLFFMSVSILAKAQISSSAADGTKELNNYEVFIFCATPDNLETGILTATSPTGEIARFLWEKFNTATQTFETYFDSRTDSSLQSTISDLADGGYKVTINDGMVVSTYFAWVLNSWLEVTYAEIPDSSSNCEEFKIWATYDYAPLMVYDTLTNTTFSARNANFKFKTQWFQDQELVASALSPYIYSLIASDDPVPYKLLVTDEFDCTAGITIDYDSKIPKSDFIYDPSTGEAVLEVSFTNNSINYDSALWFFYKDAYIISKDIEAAKGGAVDSIDFVLVEDAPVHQFLYSGEYRVKLVTVKINETTGNCRDTLYMEPGTFILVDTSLVEIPNVFTPNGDGVNDVFVVRSQSLKSMNIKIFNRWGGLVHSWKYSNITSKDYTYEHSVWDGRIGNRMAAPGVYFYTITYEGRNLDKEKDNGRFKKRTEQGFVHLFRNKN